MKITVSQLRRIIREELKRNLDEGDTLGLAQKIAGEYPEEEVRDFLTAPDPEGFGLLPDEIGDDLKDFLSYLAYSDLKTLKQHFDSKKQGVGQRSKSSMWKFMS